MRNAILLGLLVLTLVVPAVSASEFIRSDPCTDLMISSEGPRCKTRVGLSSCGDLGGISFHSYICNQPIGQDLIPVSAGTGACAGGVGDIYVAQHVDWLA